MIILTKDMAIDHTLWIHTFMTQEDHSHQKYTMELRHDKNIAMDQYTVDLCDSIYQTQINFHQNFGRKMTKLDA